MQLSETIKLYPTKNQVDILYISMATYIETVNHLVSNAVKGVSVVKYTSKDIDVSLPSAIKNQCIRDAKSILNKHYKSCHKTVLRNRNSHQKTTIASKLPVLRKPCYYVNNQNFNIKNSLISFSVFINGKSTRISIMTKMTTRQQKLLGLAKLGTMRIVIKNNHIVAQVIYEPTELEPLVDYHHIMGVDLGIKCPAVSYCSNGFVRFYGNGRKNKYLRRQYKHLRHKLQRSKKMKALRRINDKEQRIMYDIDHKISRDIVNTAVKNHVNIIKLEQLTNIRSTTRTSRKNNHSLHNWSFYRLAQFIEYKAKLVGIKVEYINPAYTSQKCPTCGQLHHTKDRLYTCHCGFHIHRDLLGAMNICNSTEFVGNRQTA